MRIAVLGDIHGNFEALKTVYAEAVKKGTDKIYHLGDLGGYAPFVNEVVDFVIEHGIEGASLGFEWTKNHASLNSKEYMRNLPPEIRLTVNSKKVIIFHASPKKNNLYWYEDRPEKFFSEMAEKTDADVMIYGHTHKPYRKDVGGKVFINDGSVGKPKDGDTRTCVTLVEITGERVETEFIRVTYDVEKTAWAIVESGLPPYFAEKLRQGK